ncbi:MAG: hypothetical protein H5U19_10120 [Rhodobacteraceae bacterium]|nr:hypothetical protein [Paracoccaceae bacterium]
MFEAIIASTSSEGLRPLGTPPQRSYELITGTLEQRLSPAHAHLFAEPISTSYGDKLDWYAPVAGTLRKLSDLEDPARAEAKARLDQLRQDIEGLAQSISASKNPDEQRLGESLSNALKVPGPDCIYVLTPTDGAGVQPVLINWARVHDQQAEVSRGLVGADTRRVARAAAQAPMAASTAAAPLATQGHGGDDRRQTSILPWLWWGGWGLLALIIAAILYLLIPACGLVGFDRYSSCQSAEAPVSIAAAETARLENEIARIRRQLGVLDRACQPIPSATPIVAPPPPPPPEPEQETEIDRRLERAGAQRGKLSFSLFWNDTSDLDLHVQPPGCPRTIFYGTRSACGGTLDVDANAQRRRPDPVENTFFVDPRPGRYSVKVNLFSGTNAGRDFTLQIRDHGRLRTFSGRVDPRNPNWIHSYTTGGN